MNLKGIVFKYGQPNLGWSDGIRLQKKYGLHESHMYALDGAITAFSNLKVCFERRKESVCPEIWDDTIELVSSHLANHLKYLESV